MKKTCYLTILCLLYLIAPYTALAQLGEITDINLIFTPVDGGDSFIAEAFDIGDGLEVIGDIELAESTVYDLSIEINNGVNDLDTLIAQNAEDYIFFYGFTEGIFTSPDGNGNVDNRLDPVEYGDQDANEQPIGLTTSWTTTCVEEVDIVSGTFRIVLQFQPDSKSDTSSIATGATQWDLTWSISVVDDLEAPPCENEEEIITDVVLTFTSEDSSSVVTATAQDPDGEGVLNLAATGPIELLESTEYTLSIELSNEIEGEDITEEIREEDFEHIFFFIWTDELFASPEGDGNVDNREDPVNYNDEDGNGLPVGLSTSWTTACTEADVEGTFIVILKHQPGQKSGTSTFLDGGTDLDVEWDITIIDDPEAPPCENEEEIITDVILTFTSEDSSSVVVVTAQDPDGEGPLDLEVTEDFGLQPNTEYSLKIELRNEIEGEDITEEIEAEDNEHMFFFAWTEGLFVSPEGDGNIDNRQDPVNYNDEDENGLPVGLSTSWTTGDSIPFGSFSLVLKHQPDLKSATSTVDDGGTDLELTWSVGGIPTTQKPVIQQEGLKIWPNPATSMLNWSIESGTPSQVNIYDAMGRIVFSKERPEKILDVNHLSPGTYIVLFTGEQKIWRERVIIQ